MELTGLDDGEAQRRRACSTGWSWGAVVRDGRALRVSVSDGARALIAAVRALDAVGIEPATAAVREPTLDDVFLALTGRRAERRTDENDEAAARGRERRCGMSTTALRAPFPVAASGWRASRFGARDVVAMTWRNLLTIRRVPQLLVFATIQPLLFVLMFRYVFGGAIHVAGVDYVNYLMPGDLRPGGRLRRGPDRRSAWPPTCAAVSSSACDRCRWRGRPCSPGARSPTSAATCSW